MPTLLFAVKSEVKVAFPAVGRGNYGAFLNNSLLDKCKLVWNRVLFAYCFCLGHGAL